MDEFFQTGEDFTSHEYYPDLTSYCRLGEDAFPNVVDDKGNITSGELVGRYSSRLRGYSSDLIFSTGYVNDNH